MTTQITVSGTDCYKLAAQYLGDATQWWRIMLQNSLTDPIIGPPTSITIPDVNPALTGGLPEAVAPPRHSRLPRAVPLKGSY